MRATAKELEYWAARTEEVARSFGLDPYPVVYDLVPEHVLVEEVVLQGLPLRYMHWSRGKAAEIAEVEKPYLGLGATDLIGHGNPTVVKLLNANNLAVHVLCMADALARSDFMQHNRLYRLVDLRQALTSLRFGRERIEQYRRNETIGSQAVQAVIDAAHAIRFVRRFPSSRWQPSFLRQVAELSPSLDDWARDTLMVIDEEVEQAGPAIETKFLLQGWASYWHYEITKALIDLPSAVRDAIRLEHARVVRRLPNVQDGEYHNARLMGSELFRDIRSRWDAMSEGRLPLTRSFDGHSGLEKIFMVRRFERDTTAFAAYLTEELGRTIMLNRYGPARPATGGGQNPAAPPITFLDVSDAEGWEAVRDTLVRELGFGLWPSFEVHDVNYTNKGKLYLKHEWDGRDLDAEWTELAIRHLRRLWEPGVVIETKTRRSRQTFWYIMDAKGFRKGRGTVRGNL